jgi:predicted unusual protein kinase regulating ubiquinone biosynthesis (AarF/ABC1/UbiB family)
MIIKLVDHLSRENILYVKMFQAIALNNTWINEELNQYLLKFTDNAPYDNNDIDWETVEYIMKLGNFTFLNNDTDTFFKPINSGMISIVYILQNQKTKEKVILKLKRMNIEKKINDGIQKIIFLINVLSFLPIIKQYNISDILQKNIKDIYEQTDFNQEIKNMKLLKEKYKNLKYIKIPDVFDFKDKIIDDKYKNKFIIMEYIKGYNISTLPEEYYETYAKLVLKFAFASVFNFGITHGDLHSGNIIFIKDTNSNTNDKDKFLLGLIDFGILLKINEDMKYLFIDIFTELFNVPPIETAKKLINPIILQPKNILDKMSSEQHTHIIEMCADIIKNIISESTNINQIHFYETVKKINDYLNGEKISELGLKPNDDFIKLQLAIAMSHGITLKLCKKNYINITKSVLQEMFYI